MSRRLIPFRKQQEAIVKSKNNSGSERYKPDTVDVENARIYVALLDEAENKFPNQNIVINTPIPDTFRSLNDLRGFFYNKFRLAYGNISHIPNESWFNWKPDNFLWPEGANYSYKNHAIKELINQEEGIVYGLRSKYIQDNFEEKRNQIREVRKGIIAGPLINLSKSKSNVNLINLENIRKNAESRRYKELNGLFGGKPKKSQCKKKRTTRKIRR
jgi:hypothetical protein